MEEQLLKFAVNVLFNRFDLLVMSHGRAAMAIYCDVSGAGVHCLLCSNPHKNNLMKGRPTVHLGTSLDCKMPHLSQYIRAPPEDETMAGGEGWECPMNLVWICFGATGWSQGAEVSGH